MRALLLVRRQKSEVRGQRSEVRSQKSEGKKRLGWHPWALRFSSNPPSLRCSMSRRFSPRRLSINRLPHTWCPLEHAFWKVDNSRNFLEVDHALRDSGEFPHIPILEKPSSRTRRVTMSQRVHPRSHSNLFELHRHARTTAPTRQTQPRRWESFLFWTQRQFTGGAVPADEDHKY
jgi:hypothetical protein